MNLVIQESRKCPLSGAAVFSTVRALSAPPQDNSNSHGPRLDLNDLKTCRLPRRPMRVAVEKPHGWRASLGLHFFLRACPCRLPVADKRSREHRPVVTFAFCVLTFAFWLPSEVPDGQGKAAGLQNRSALLAFPFFQILCKFL